MKITIKPAKIGIDFKTQKVYPELENLEITPRAFEQKFNHPNSYGYDGITVKAMEVNLQDKEITDDGTYEADKEYDGLGKITVNTEEAIANKYFNTDINDTENGIINYLIKMPNLDISNATNLKNLFSNCTNIKQFPDLNTSHVTNMSNMFNACKFLTKNPNMDTSSVTNMSGMFSNCAGLTSFDSKIFNTSNVTDISSMFMSCLALINLDLSNFDTRKVTAIHSMFSSCMNIKNLDLSSFDLSKAISIGNMFYNCRELINLKSFKNLGKGYTAKSANYGNYKLVLSYSNLLSYESLIDVINNLYDLNLTYDVANGGTLYAQTLQIGETNIAKLTAEEIAIATNKGWNVT